MAIAHRLAERHHVRNDAGTLVTPHVGTRPPETRLHLVRDQQPAGLPDDCCGPPEKTIRQIRETLIGEEWIDDQRRKTERCLLKILYSLVELRRPGIREGFARNVTQRPIAVGCRHMADMAAIATD